MIKKKTVYLTPERITRQVNILKNLIKSLVRNKNLNEFRNTLKPISDQQSTKNTIIENIESFFPNDNITPTKIIKLQESGRLKTITGDVLSKSDQIFISPGIYSGYETVLDSKTYKYLSTLILSPSLKQDFSSNKQALVEFCNYHSDLASIYPNSATFTISGFGSTSVSNLHSQMFNNDLTCNDRRSFDKEKSWNIEELVQYIPILWDKQIFFNIAFDGEGKIYLLSPKNADGELISFLDYQYLDKLNKAMMIELLINKPGGLESINDNDLLYVDKTTILDLILEDKEMVELFEKEGILKYFDRERFSLLPRNLLEIDIIDLSTQLDLDIDVEQNNLIAFN